MVLLPNLMELRQVDSEPGVIKQESETTLVVKAKIGMASELRLRLLVLV